MEESMRDKIKKIECFWNSFFYKINFPSGIISLRPFVIGLPSSYSKSKVSAFRKVIAYLVSFSLIWSNCVFAQGPTHIIEEDFKSSSVRMYVGNKMGVVDPGHISEGIVHNIFDELQLHSNGGVIFKGDPDTWAIFNRFYSKNPIQLSGAIQSDNPLPMVFANQKGINLENADFTNISALTLLAGGVAKTDKGMAYAVDDGTVSFHKTILEKENTLKKLTLSGRGIQISESLLSPEMGIDLTVGQHIGSLNTEENLEHPTAFMTEETTPFPFKNSVTIDEHSALQSKNLRLRSFDEGAAITCLGLLKSTDEDIYIHAKGDIYLNHLMAAGNLHIKTTGNVYFGKQAWIGGTTNIIAKDIHIEEKFNSIGKALFQASGILNLKGSLSCEDVLSLNGTQAVNLLGTVTSKGKLTALSQGDILQSGSLSSGNTLDIKGKSFKTTGQIKSEGTLIVETENNLENEKGKISSLSASRFISQKGNIINKGKIFSAEQLNFTASQTDNYGFLETQGHLYTKGILENKKRAQIEAKSLSDIQTHFSQNQGVINLKDSINLRTDSSVLKGTIKTQGKLNFIGNALEIEGDVSTEMGANFNLKTLTNRGRLTASGTGLHGTIETLLNKGKLDFSIVNATIKNATNEKEGAIRTKSHFLVKGNNYTNNGKVFTCGVHEVNLDTFYKDSGIFYSPTLFLLKAHNITLAPGHNSFLKEGVIQAAHKFLASEKVSFSMESNVGKCFLQLSSQGDLQFNGKIEQYSNSSFPFSEYYRIFKESDEKTLELAKEISTSSFEPWNNLKKNLGSGVTLRAGKDLYCQNSTIQPESGIVSLVAEEKIQTDKANIKSGFFKGNNATAKSKKAVLENSHLTSLFGKATLIVDEDAHLSNFHLTGKESALIMANVLNIERGSSVQSPDGNVGVEGKKELKFEDSRFQGINLSFQGGETSGSSSQLLGENSIHFQTNNATLSDLSFQAKTMFTEVKEKISISLSSFQGEFNKLCAKEVDLTKTKFEVKETCTEAKEKLKIFGGGFNGELHRIYGDDIEADSLSTKGTTLVAAQNNLGLSHLIAQDHVEVVSQHIHTNNVEAPSLTAKGVHVTIQKDLQSKDLTIEAKESYNDKGSHIKTDKTTLIAKKTRQLNGTYDGNEATFYLDGRNEEDLTSLLNRLKVKQMSVYFPEADIHITKDLHINPHLYLSAKTFKNSANIMTDGNFGAHLDKTFENLGMMDIQGQGYFEATDSLANRNYMRGQQGLGLKTNGLLTHKPFEDGKHAILDGGSGILNLYGHEIDANALSIRSRSVFLGHQIYAESETNFGARSADVRGDDVTFVANNLLDLTATKETFRSEKNQSSFLGLSHTKTTNTWQEAIVFDASCTEKLKLYSVNGQIIGEGASLSAPWMKIHGEKGVSLKELRLKKTEQIEKKRFCFEIGGIDLINPFEDGLPTPKPSVEVGFRTQRTSTTQSYGVLGNIHSSHLELSTGQNVGADLQGSNLKADRFVTNTPFLKLGGASNDQTQDNQVFKATGGIAFVGVFVPTASISASSSQNKNESFQFANV
jgi:filamentous hemagglutinin family protein